MTSVIVLERFGQKPSTAPEKNYNISMVDNLKGASTNRASTEVQKFIRPTLSFLGSPVLERSVAVVWDLGGWVEKEDRALPAF